MRKVALLLMFWIALVLLPLGQFQAQRSPQVGSVVGPGSSTDNTVVRFDGTTGTVIQGSGVTIDDSNNIGAVANLTASGRFVNSTITTFGDGDTDPSVAGSNLFKTANTASTSITGFDDATVGQRIAVIFGDANTTFVDSAGLQLQGSGDFLSSTNDTMELVYDGSTWFEMNRSVN